MTPNIYNFDLWKTSGHAAHYKENMFLINIEKQEFGLKPMNCPGGHPSRPTYTFLLYTLQHVSQTQATYPVMIYV